VIRVALERRAETEEIQPYFPIEFCTSLVDSDHQMSPIPSEKCAIIVNETSDNTDIRYGCHSPQISHEKPVGIGGKRCHSRDSSPLGRHCKTKLTCIFQILAGKNEPMRKKRRCCDYDSKLTWLPFYLRLNV